MDPKELYPDYDNNNNDPYHTAGDGAETGSSYGYRKPYFVIRPRGAFCLASPGAGGYDQYRMKGTASQQDQNRIKT